jgi:Ca2+-binding EF-hand superfamily protein
MSQKQNIERRVALMLLEINDKMNVLTGFGAEIVKIRALRNLLKQFDKSQNGCVNLEQFHEFMVARLHFVAVNKEVEELFNRFDPEMTCWINYEELAYNLLGHGGTPKLSSAALKTMDTLRSLLLKKGIYTPLTFCVAARSLPSNRDGNAPMSSAVQNLSGLFGGRISSAQLRSLLSAFDTHHCDQVNISSFLAAFKAGMSMDRKRLVRAIFDKIDDNKRGFITTDEMSRYYIQDFESRVIDGIAIEPRSLSEAIAFMTAGQSDEDQNKIFWPQFLDFYCYLSLGIDDHDIFEYFLRNSWCIDKPSATVTTTTNMARSPDSPVRMMMNLNVGFGSSQSSLGSPSTTPTAKKGLGQPFRRGMVVTHSDGREEVVEMIDELGKTQIDAESIISFITSKGVQDVSDIRI